MSSSSRTVGAPLVLGISSVPGRARLQQASHPPVMLATAAHHARPLGRLSKEFKMAPVHTHSHNSRCKSNWPPSKLRAMLKNSTVTTVPPWGSATSSSHVWPSTAAGCKAELSWRGRHFVWLHTHPGSPSQTTKSFISLQSSTKKPPNVLKRRHGGSDTRRHHRPRLERSAPGNNQVFVRPCFGAHLQI